MTLAAGARLGPYEILAPLGAGGMGEVYRARDSKLRREVAVKVLPASFSGDPERLARFEREAHLLASLNHPNIAAIYGLEESDGVRFLVLELVPGETLAERFAAGPLPIGEALATCRQIAEALEAAHEKGIIHRDLKPANIKVTPEGKVKVLDFGLAKAFAAEDSSPDLSHSPTVTLGETREGVILGTAAYMSPEQARGRPLDKRTDIWSFGCVLYEALTGQRAFSGETVSDTIAAILRAEVNWNALPSGTPINITWLLKRSLQKDPSRRLHDIADARIEIDEELTGSAGPPAGGPREARSHTARWRLTLPSVLASVLLGSIATALLFWRLKSPSHEPLQLTHFTVSLPPKESLVDDLGPALALSPEGSNLIYAADRGTHRQLYVRAMGELESKPIAGSERGSFPFFSPDGRWVAFNADLKLKKVPLSGGTPVVLADAPAMTGASWTRDGTIYFTPVPGSGIWKVAATGAKPEVVTRPDPRRGEAGHPWPDALPDGKALLFTIELAGKSYDDARIALLDLASGKQRILIDGGTHARYVPTGHLVYERAAALLAAPFDLERLEVTGEPVPVLDGVLIRPGSGAAHYSFSQNGSLAYVPGSVGAYNRRLVLVDRTGATRILPAPPRRYYQPRFSPDGTRLSVGIEAANDDVWVIEVSRGTLSRLTFEAENLSAIWTPDGSRLTFSSHTDGPANLYWTAADGSGAKERLTVSDKAQWAGSWSPDGRTLALTEEHPETGTDIWVLSIEGERKLRPLLRTPFSEKDAVFSPDGRSIAYVSNESGRDEVYVIPYPGPGGKSQISTEGGEEPVWAPNGRELFYREGDKIVAAAVTLTPTFRAERPKPLFEARFEEKKFAANYDVAAEGRQFVMVQSEAKSEAANVNVVLGWFEELKRRVPSGKNR